MVDIQGLHNILEETLKITKQNSKNIAELAQIVKANSEETKQPFVNSLLSLLRSTLKLHKYLTMSVSRGARVSIIVPNIRARS